MHRHDLTQLIKIRTVHLHLRWHYKKRSMLNWVYSIVFPVVVISKLRCDISELVHKFHSLAGGKPFYLRPIMSELMFHFWVGGAGIEPSKVGINL